MDLSLAALSLSAAVAIGPAVAAITWNPYPNSTLFEGDDIDFIFDESLNPKAGGLIRENDVLISIHEIDSANGTPIQPDELTGVVAIQVNTISPTSNPFLFDLTFRPFDGGLNAVLALGSTDETVAGGGAGGGAVAAFWLDPSPNLDISVINLPVPPGSLSCTRLTQCIDQSVDGSLWAVDGFAGDPDENWIALDAGLDTSVVLAIDPAIPLGVIKAAGSILYNGTGQNLQKNGLSCFPFCGAGGDGFVDVVANNIIQGGAGLPASLIADGAVATSDFDFEKRAVPEPSTLALLAGGFLGVGAARRRRRKASRV